WKKIAKVHCIENDKIIDYAELLYKNNIRTKDALHIACSVYTDSNYFITTDKHLFNLKLDDIKIINPLNFLNEVEE
ncbi:MAG: PIN domain protein, partial [Treponema sp.]|nr:PIN domain protein [Treponema sp.]